jgi:hypothetical protein
MPMELFTYDEGDIPGRSIGDIIRFKQYRKLFDAGWRWSHIEQTQLFLVFICMHRHDDQIAMQHYRDGWRWSYIIQLPDGSRRYLDHFHESQLTKIENLTYLEKRLPIKYT